jgi:hypothetical protein
MLDMTDKTSASGQRADPACHGGIQHRADQVLVTRGDRLGERPLEDLRIAVRDDPDDPTEGFFGDAGGAERPEAGQHGRALASRELERRIGRDIGAEPRHRFLDRRALVRAAEVYEVADLFHGRVP